MSEPTAFEKLMAAQANLDLRTREFIEAHKTEAEASVARETAAQAVKAAEIVVHLGHELVFRVAADNGVTILRNQFPGGLQSIARTSPAHIAKFVEDLIAAGVLRFETVAQCAPVKVEAPT